MNSQTPPFLVPIVGLINKVDALLQTDYRARLISWKTGFHSSDYRFPQEKMAFIHTPKTGGTTISAVLETSGGDDRFVNLHMHRPVSRHCPSDQYAYFTMLRHPVSRVYSFYKMAERKDPDNPYSHLCTHGIEHFISRCWETRNLCCRYLAGETRKEVDEQLYEKARNNLLNFRFVGIFEQFETSIHQLLALLGESGRHLPHHRKSSHDMPSDADRSIIEKYNQYDIRLYEFWLNHLKSAPNPNNV